MTLLVNAEHDQEKVVMYHSYPKYWNRNACTYGDSPDQLLLVSILIRARLRNCIYLASHKFSECTCFSSLC